ncbi:hypothetical protein KY285_031519 [Solanum tuberosum]|nr:hypothetical protein KY284_031304 [Solanum tuberosum]KAH0656637.1 hypothetical protein KY285_031519 [Solanum tuberosum]
MLNAGAVIHSHGMESCLVTMLNPLAKEFQIKAYPRTTAVLVCNHDIYVWGDSCISAKTQELTGQRQLMLPFRMQKQVYLLKWQHKAIKVQQDLENGVAGAVYIPSIDAGEMEIIASLVTNVEAMIKADRKITALKELQVRTVVMKFLLGSLK